MMNTSRLQAHGGKPEDPAQLLRQVMGGFGREIDIRLYYQMLLRRKWWFVFPFITLLGLGFIYVLFQRPYYEASTTILVERTRYLSRDVGTLDSPISLSGSMEMIRRQILSKENLRHVIDLLAMKNNKELDLQAQKLAPRLPELGLDQVKELILVSRLRKRFTLRPLRENVLEITATAPSADMAFTLVKTMAQVFIDQSQRTEISGLRSASSFSEEQLEIYKSRLQDAEERLRQFHARQPRETDEEVQDKQNTMDRISAALSEIELQLADNSDRTASLRSQEQQLGIDEVRLDSPRLSSLKSRLLERASRLSEVLLKYSWKDAVAIQLNDGIAQLREESRKELLHLAEARFGTDGTGAADLIVEKHLAELDSATLGRQQQTLSDLMGIYRQAGAGDTEKVKLSLLEQEVRINREIYNMFREQSQKVQIQEALQRKEAENRFKLLEPPEKPLQPKRTSRKMIMMVAAAAGLGLGGCLVYGLEFLDTSFKTATDVENALSIPVLGAVPSIQMLTPPRSRKGVILATFGILFFLLGVFSWYFLRVGLP